MLSSLYCFFYISAIDLINSSFTNVGTSISSLVPKRDEITRICWTDDEQTKVLTVNLDRQLKLYDTITNAYTSLFNVDSGTGSINGLVVNQRYVYMSKHLSMNNLSAIL